jgi:hypothetical protein
MYVKSHFIKLQGPQKGFLQGPFPFVFQKPNEGPGLLKNKRKKLGSLNTRGSNKK